MKILEISEGKAYYNKLNERYSVIDITSEDIEELIKIVFVDEVEIDVLSEENAVNNPVEKIIYEQLSLELNKVIDKKESIIKEIDDEFKSASEKYTVKDEVVE
jgi:hypothetical protein